FSPATGSARWPAIWWAGPRRRSSSRSASARRRPARRSPASFPCRSGMTLAVVINAASGTAQRHGPDQLKDLVGRIARETRGESVDVRVVPPKQLLPALRQAAQDHDEVWVGGGDGTLRSAAELMVKRRGTLGVLPLGTMNLLARDLNIPLE